MDIQCGECIWTPTNDKVSNATGGDLAQLVAWQAQMQANVSRLNGVVVPGETGNAGQEDQGAVQQLQHISGDGEPSVCPTNANKVAGVLSAANPAMLKDDQFHAFDIICWHLNKTLAGKELPLLWMILYGEGGTGKSKVIQTVTEDFAAQGAHGLLVKVAYTGVAASMIDRKTTHTIAALTVKRRDTQTLDIPGGF
ncbi:hypothetical protein PHLCEN_2v1321 [Hermanssonia centrifuga]|uniref:ATP-dependent DNA helicase n=1 Tax=Hermanssonia centrifuga TaxID=98765 RepID=A0A2R6S3J7_9APHY|nr:hypothetical protein PHLCEN_2v1321 [Hermanssonia centrifuga]